MFKYFIKVFGCPMRGVEAERVNRYFSANGGSKSPRGKADIVIIFGCSIVELNNSITMEYIKSVDNDKQRIIISGCSPVISKEEIREFFDGELLVSKELDNIDELFPEFKVKYKDILLPTVSHKDLDYNKFYLNQYKHYRKKSSLSFNNKPQLLITSKGCPNACSYCTVRFAMGNINSYPEDTILKTYKKALEKKQQVFIFNGDDTGAYGIDINSGFDKLLLKLEGITPKDQYVKWAIDNLHPRWLLKYQETLLKFIKQGRIVDMVVPLQAATEKLLKLMRRNYKISEIISVLKEFKEANPKLKLTTHFLFGFPGELDNDIEAIKQIIDQNCFNHYVALRYFEAPKADSVKITPKVPITQAQKRMKEIQDYIIKKGYYCQITEHVNE